MKVLSIQQPWAELICMGIKDVENRSWPTKYRGNFLIHASKKFDLDSLDIIQARYGLFLDKEPSDFQTGGIIGESILIACVRGYDSIFSIPGEYQFVLIDSKFVKFQACNGKLGFWELPQ